MAQQLTFSRYKRIKKFITENPDETVVMGAKRTGCSMSIYTRVRDSLDYIDYMEQNYVGVHDTFKTREHPISRDTISEEQAQEKPKSLFKRIREFFT